MWCTHDYRYFNPWALYNNVQVSGVRGRFRWSLGCAGDRSPPEGGALLIRGLSGGSASLPKSAWPCGQA